MKANFSLSFEWRGMAKKKKKKRKRKSIFKIKNAKTIIYLME
jgi:hypothetical protein